MTWFGLAAFLMASPVFAFDCLIEPAQTVELASPITGVLDRVTVKRGDRISKGQVLAVLESQAEQAAVELARFKSEQVGPLQLAERKVDFSRRKFERLKVMTADNLMPAQEGEDAESEYQLAEAELTATKENREQARIELRQQSSLLNLRTLRSPFNGVVVDQKAFAGEVVEPSGEKKYILKLAQLHPLRVQVILPKHLFGKVAAGASAEVVPELPALGKLPARIKTIDHVIDAASGTFVAFLEMPNPKLAIPAGMKCKATFPGVK
jgi:RND family efflux transporter MFP subunit